MFLVMFEGGLEAAKHLSAGFEQSLETWTRHAVHVVAAMINEFCKRCFEVGAMDGGIGRGFLGDFHVGRKISAKG